METDKITYMIYELHKISDELEQNARFQQNVETSIKVLFTLLSSYITTLFIAKTYRYFQRPKSISTKETQSNCDYYDDDSSSSSSCNCFTRDAEIMLQDIDNITVKAETEGFEEENLVKAEEFKNFYDVDISS